MKPHIKKYRFDFWNKYSINNVSSITKALSKALFNSFTSNTQLLKDEIEKWKDVFFQHELIFDQQDFIKEKILRKKSLTNIYGKSIKNDDFENIAIICLQTTFLIVIKTIVFETLTKTKKTSSIQPLNYYTSLEQNSIILNVSKNVPCSFFSLYINTEYWNDEVAIALRSVYNMVKKDMEGVFLYEDTFKNLYMQIIPSEIRHRLGEYYTPSWMADYIIDSIAPAKKLHKYSFVDPCCGSGIFILKLINKIISKLEIKTLSPEEKSALLNNILSHVKGIDLNPLAVISARLGYLMAISPLLTDYTQKIDIPVYFGDSANLPNSYENKYFEFNIYNNKRLLKFYLPKSLVYYNKLQQIIRLFVPLIKNNIDYKSINLGKYFPNVSSYKIVTDYFVDLGIIDKRNIILQIINNIRILKNIKKVDFIIGNPPWINWKTLPPNYLQNAINYKIIEKIKFKKINICSLITPVVADAFLKAGGKFAFLMPKNLLLQEQYKGFRQPLLSKNKYLYLYQIDDWEKSGHPFRGTYEKFLTYYFSYSFKKKDIRVNYINKLPSRNILEINEQQSFERVKDDFAIHLGICTQLSSNYEQYSLLTENDNLNDFKIIQGICDYLITRKTPPIYARNYLLLSDNSKLRCEMFLNRELKGIYKKHQVVIYRDKNLNFLTAAEIFYLSAIFNSSIVQRYFSATFMNTSFNFRHFSLFIPKYNSQHPECLSLSQAINSTTVLTDALRREFSDLYIKLCKSIHNKQS